MIGKEIEREYLMWNSLRDLSPTGLHTERCLCVCGGGLGYIQWDDGILLK